MIKLKKILRICIIGVILLGVFTFFFDIDVTTQDDCIEISEPFCMPILTDDELKDMAIESEKDLEKMIHGIDFIFWVENGCIYSCMY